LGVPVAPTATRPTRTREEGVMRHRSEAGETLAEIVLTIVLIGLAVAALLAALGTAAGASKQHRDLANADIALRSYAEATKEAVRHQCGDLHQSSYTVPFPAQHGFTGTGGDGSCPLPGSPRERTLVVTNPEHTTTAQMTIVVRTP